MDYRWWPRSRKWTRARVGVLGAGGVGAGYELGGVGGLGAGHELGGRG